MGDVQSAWREVGEKFTELGYKFRDHYRKLEAERAETGEATEESEQAFKKVADEVDTAFSSVGNAFRDAEVKDDAKAAANSLLAAFGATFQEIGDAFQRAIGRTQSDLEAEAGQASVDDAAEEIAEAVADEPDEDNPPAEG
ncbi:MAG TPA: hypothetical protein VJ482_02555 [Acidimicrobiia bacterium]|nr:hypothetical protein [Acidimicrobiia bacterium]